MKKITTLPIVIFFTSLILIGCFHEETSCLISAFLSVALVIYSIKNKKIYLKMNLLTISVFVIVFAYLITAIWAVDRGIAIIGFVKYLPLLIFSVIIMQDSEVKERIINFLPYFSAGITVITAVLMQIPALKNYFSVAGRFSGCFEYPNTFAMLLLISELLLVSKKNIKKYDIAVLAVLIFGIFFTGSRTVFVLAVISNAVMIIKSKNKIIKIGFAGFFGISIIAVTVYTLIFGNNVFGRFLTIGIKESTFVGRFLYFSDALPVILKHPFGFGYNGYYYMQQSFQTGLYSVRNIHNDFLQIALDIGIIPCLLFVVAIIKAIISKKTSFERKIIISTFVLHSCFDFNLQFISMFFILLLLIYDDSGKEFEIKSKALTVAILSLISLVSIYFGIAVFSYRLKDYSLCEKIYPYYTDNNIELLKKAETADEMDMLADKILNQNEYVSLCYSAKAKTAYSNGDFKGTMEYKHKLFDYAPFNTEDYKEYCYMLANAISIYSRSGDLSSADYCKQELIDTYDNLQSLPSELSKLGKMIKDKPDTELPDDITEYILKLKGDTK